MAKRTVRCAPTPAEMLAALLLDCRPASIAELWGSIPVAEHCFQCPADAAATCSKLVQQFPADALMASGILVAAEGELVLEDSLRDPQEIVVAIRKSPRGPTIDLLTSSGCLSGAEWPVIVAFREHRVRELMAKFDRRMLVAFSMPDVVLLRSLGIPATLGVGLERFDIELLDELAGKFRWDDSERQEYLRGFIGDNSIGEYDGNVPAAPPRQRLSYPRIATPSGEAPEASELEDCADGGGEATDDFAGEHGEIDQPCDTSRPQAAAPGNFSAPRLVLLGWSPTRMDLTPPDEMLLIARYLEDASRHLGIQAFDEVGQWVPSSSSFQDIAICLAYGLPEATQAAMQDSFHNDCLSLPSEYRPASSDPADIPEALAQLRKVARQQVPRADRPQDRRSQQAWEHYERRLENDLEYPLLTAAGACDDLLRKQKLLALAGLAKLAHRQAALLNQALERQAAEVALSGELPPPPAGLKDYLAMLRVVAALTKEPARK